MKRETITNASGEILGYAIPILDGYAVRSVIGRDYLGNELPWKFIEVHYSDEYVTNGLQLYYWRRTGQASFDLSPKHYGM